MYATLAGPLTQDPKVKINAKKKLMVKIVIADEIYTGTLETQYVIAIGFDRNAAYISHYVRKGDIVYLTGQMINQKYKQPNGEYKYFWFFKIDKIKTFYTGPEHKKNKKEAPKEPEKKPELPEKQEKDTPKNNEVEDKYETLEFEGMEDI